MTAGAEENEPAAIVWTRTTTEEGVVTQLYINGAFVSSVLVWGAQ